MALANSITSRSCQHCFASVGHRKIIQHQCTLTVRIKNVWRTLMHGKDCVLCRACLNRPAAHTHTHTASKHKSHTNAPHSDGTCKSMQSPFHTAAHRP